jgi:hypothetical protein
VGQVSSFLWVLQFVNDLWNRSVVFSGYSSLSMTCGTDQWFSLGTPVYQWLVGQVSSFLWVLQFVNDLQDRSVVFSGYSSLSMTCGTGLIFSGYSSLSMTCGTGQWFSLGTPVCQWLVGQVSDFLWVLQFVNDLWDTSVVFSGYSIKTECHNITEIFLKMTIITTAHWKLISSSQQ